VRPERHGKALPLGAITAARSTRTTSPPALA
jgi:hypothetical protein